MQENERRTARRLPLSLPLVVQGYSQGRNFEEITSSINISTTGACFLLSHPVPENTELEVTVVPLSDLGESFHARFRARGRVVRRNQSNPVLPSAFIAIQFTEQLRLNSNH